MLWTFLHKVLRENIYRTKLNQQSRASLKISSKLKHKTTTFCVYIQWGNVRSDCSLCCLLVKVLTINVYYATFYWSTCTRPGKCAVMICILGIWILIFLQFSIGCSDSVFISIVFGKLFKTIMLYVKLYYLDYFYWFLLWNPLNIFFILLFLLLELIVNHKGSSPME